jgi:hypothetical protein
MIHRKNIWIPVLGLLFCLSGCKQDDNPTEQGRYYKVEYQPSTESNGLALGVTYTLWVPEGVSTIRGVIVHQHGAGIPAAQSGMSAAFDLHWQALAKKWDCVLLGPSYHVETADMDDSQAWFDARRGSDQTFLKALDEFSTMVGHPEIATVPWCLWGHSGGGIWSHLMATLHPERVAAIWLRSGAATMWNGRPNFPEFQNPEAVYSIPIICNPGIEEQNSVIWSGQMEIFKDYRAHGAPIGFAPDPLTGHWCGDSRYLAIPFFDACMEMRLPEAGKAAQTLRPIDMRNSWYAPLLGDTALSATAYQGDINSAVWLPNEDIAKKWMEYVKTGEVSDITPPPAPFNVKVTGNTVTWNAEADFESGIGHFIILRDGKRYARVPEKPLLRFQVRPLFQSGYINSYNDSPVYPVPEMSFTDSLATGKHSYTVISVNSVGLPSLISDGTTPLPWQTEASLKEAAKTTVIERTLHPTNPMPSVAMTVNNLKMRTTIWGPPNQITISVTKNNVWDRRVNWYTPPTIEEITEGAFSPANKDYLGYQPGLTLRPVNLGWLKKEGGEIDPYRKPVRYAFPCLKPVGQIIVGIDPLAGAQAPMVTQNCGTGVTSLQIAKGDAKANLEYVLLMDKDVYAIKGSLSGIKTTAWLRLYRHRDTSHQMYMTADGKRYTVPEAEKDKAFNGPMAPPASGTDGKYFWIRQKMPAEKTFPEGFEYVMMGVMTTAGQLSFSSDEAKTGLGTPPENQPVRGDWIQGTRAAIGDAPGAAATALFSPGEDGKFEAFVTIVTSIDGDDLLGLAKKRLEEIQSGGFDGAVKANTQWWDNFYDLREEGRIFSGNITANCTEDIKYVYQSYADSHGGGTKTDMRKFESSASYVLPEQDIQGWNSGPCYNEIFTTSTFVHNRADNQDLWKQIVEHWLPGGKEAAEKVFHLPGAFISHGYLPPVKPDRYPHVTITLELCLGTMAQIIRPAWDEWDYGGDINYLRNECYPLLKQMALFYAAYAKKGEDGFYHVIPSVQEESWGITPEFSHSKDVVSSLCMFKWGLSKASEAAELLGIDADLAKQWREVASQILPYPIWERPEGKVFAEMPGIEPVRLPADHYADAAAYPTVLSDDINLDSPAEEKEMMIRSVRTLPSASTIGALMLLGVKPEADMPRYDRIVGDPETLLNSRSGRIHLFPAVADDKAISFYHFQARNGFLVTASKNVEKVIYLEIQSRRDIDCQIMNPWQGQPVVIIDMKSQKKVPVKIDTTNGECLIFQTLANHKYLIKKSLG